MEVPLPVRPSFQACIQTALEQDQQLIAINEQASICTLFLLKLLLNAQDGMYAKSKAKGSMQIQRVTTNRGGGLAGRQVD